MNDQSSSQHDSDVGALSDSSSTRTLTRKSKSTPLVLANDTVDGFRKELGKLFDENKSMKGDIKDAVKLSKQSISDTASNKKLLEEAIEKLNCIIAASTSSSSTPSRVQQQQQHDSVSEMNMSNGQGDESADDSQYIRPTPPTSFLTPSTYTASSTRKRGRRYNISDASYDDTSVDSGDDSDTSHDDRRRSKSKSRSSPNIHHARVRAIRKLNDSDISIFNPVLAEHSKASDAPSIKSVQVMRNCISVMMQMVVKYHGDDKHTLKSASKYLGQLDRICIEYSGNDACVADLLDLDMHCRRRAGKWKYRDESETVRRYMRLLNNKLISSTPIDRDRSYSSMPKTTSSRGGQRGSSVTYGKSAAHTSTRPRTQPCWRWNGKDKSGVWTSISQCDKSDDTCTFSHVCSQCSGGHPRFSKDACKHGEHDGAKHESK
jgi:hypothetical protein